MIGARRNDGRRALGPAALLASVAGWGLIFSGFGMHGMPESGLDGSMSDLQGSGAGAAASWGLMLLGMMPPLLIAPTTYIWDRSLARRRCRSLALFVGGYALAWLPAGAVLEELAAAARAAFGHPAIPLAAAVLAASVWQASPWKQACLNRCHRLPRLSAFGLAADRDALRFGVTHGLWCAGSCGAAMAVPLFLPFGHLAMVALAACLFCERLEPAHPCRWELRVPTVRPLLGVLTIRRAAGRATS